MNKYASKFSVKTIIIKNFLMICLVAMVFGSFSIINPVHAKVVDAFEKAYEIETTQRRNSRRFGPYVTIRRANEVVRYARKKGYKAKVIYAGCLYCGTRKYYVDVWR